MFLAFLNEIKKLNQILIIEKRFYFMFVYISIALFFFCVYIDIK